MHGHQLISVGIVSIHVGFFASTMLDPTEIPMGKRGSKPLLLEDSGTLAILFSRGAHQRARNLFAADAPFPSVDLVES